MSLYSHNFPVSGVCHPLALALHSHLCRVEQVMISSPLYILIYILTSNGVKQVLISFSWQCKSVSSPVSTGVAYLSWYPAESTEESFEAVCCRLCLSQKPTQQLISHFPGWAHTQIIVSVFPDWYFPDISHNCFFRTPIFLFSRIIFCTFFPGVYFTSFKDLFLVPQNDSSGWFQDIDIFQK